MLGVPRHSQLQINGINQFYMIVMLRQIYL